MKTPGYIAADNIISSLGLETSENMSKIVQGISGIALCEDKRISPAPFYGSRVNTTSLDAAFETLASVTQYTRLERMFMLSIFKAIGQAGIDPKHKDTLFIICTTKGNVDLLETQRQGLHLWEMARTITDFFGNPNQPLIICNACISGLMGIITAKRLLETGQYQNIIVSGGDTLSEFTVSGFQAFKAISPEPCRPFDIARDGITLGEGCGTMILTNAVHPIAVTGGATSNDANHISGPSRTGEGLYLSIKKTLQDAEIIPQQIEHVCGHGTATLYNDEMEAKALTLSGLQHTYVNSLKGYFGHTLGAAGIIESIIAARSLMENTLIGTAGYHQIGVSVPLNILQKAVYKNINLCLKTGAGFGGCNAAVLLKKA
jgi:3-oxoacyl-[acyl-carrier-protein] synthase-1